MGTRSQRFPRVCLKDCFLCSCCKFTLTRILETDKEIWVEWKCCSPCFNNQRFQNNRKDFNFTPNFASFFSLLNANKIACLRVDAFQDLHNLNLLSLYDNKLQTIAKGTFSSLRAIQTLYVNTHI